ncbi:hypothetical protein [uncultured Rhodoblastus sp.]|nr:hypothetical protein [uncultured Rhodoblastus sp.]
MMRWVRGSTGAVCQLKVTNAAAGGAKRSTNDGVSIGRSAIAVIDALAQ